MCHGTLFEELHRPGFRRFGGEPELHDLLHDPMVRALMAADKVDSSDVYAVLSKAHRTSDSAC